MPAVGLPLYTRNIEDFNGLEDVFDVVEVRTLNSLLNCCLNAPFQQILCTADQLRDDLAGRLHSVNGSN